MIRRNMLALIVILALFVFAVCALIFPWFGREGMRLGLDLQGGIHVVYQVDLSSVEPGEEASVVNGVVAVIGNRINPLGVTEPVIQKQGQDRIVVELPGLSITDRYAPLPLGETHFLPSLPLPLVWYSAVTTKPSFSPESASLYATSFVEAISS